VIQKALTVPLPITATLAEAVKPYLPALRSIPYGKKLEKLVKFVQTRQMAGAHPGAHVDAGGHPWAPPTDSFAPFMDGNHLTPAHGLIPMLPPSTSEPSTQLGGAGGLGGILPPASVPIPPISEAMGSAPQLHTASSGAPAACTLFTPPEWANLAGLPDHPVNGPAALFDPSSSISAFTDTLSAEVQGIQRQGMLPQGARGGSGGSHGEDSEDSSYSMPLWASGPLPDSGPVDDHHARWGASEMQDLHAEAQRLAEMMQQQAAGMNVGDVGHHMGGELRDDGLADASEDDDVASVVQKAVEELRIEDDI